MNPYLAAAMFLAAGLDGIEQDLDPGDPQFVNMYELSDQELGARASGSFRDVTRSHHGLLAGRP